MVDQIIYREDTRTIIREVGTGVGPPGQGAVDLSRVHVQNSPATLWAVTHNMPYPPSVTVVDSAGRVVQTDVQYVTPSLIHVSMSAPFAGTVYLS